MTDILHFDPSKCGGDRRKAQRRGPALTPDGQVIVEVALTEDVWTEVLDLLRQKTAEVGLGFDQYDTPIAAIAASVQLARHHALSQVDPPLTSGQRQGYVDTGRIEPPLECDPLHGVHSDPHVCGLRDVDDEEIDRKVEAKLDEAMSWTQSLVDNDVDLIGR